MTFHLSRVSKRLFESLIGTGFESLFWFDVPPQEGTIFLTKQMPTRAVAR